MTSELCDLKNIVEEDIVDEKEPVTENSLHRNAQKAFHGWSTL